ncbi:MAG TPA: nucleotidyltransferase family protein, partial [Bacillota bacterium]|nr:nucleotidyltransferase family protein [Bacillota bacterium]
MLEAIVLAASPNEGLLKECSTAPKEALIKIAGRQMVEYVLEALDKTEEIDGIVLVGVKAQELSYQPLKPTKWTEGGANLLGSVEQGLAVVTPGNRVLLVTADIPLINPDIVKTFLRQCGDQQAEVYYPVVSREISESRFPGVRRTYATLREGTFTGGNLFLINPDVVARCRPLLLEGTRLRKRPLSLCKMLGIWFLVKYLCKRL